MTLSLSQRIERHIRELEECLGDVPDESRETVWRLLDQAREHWSMGRYISAQQFIDKVEEWFS